MDFAEPIYFLCFIPLLLMALLLFFLNKRKQHLIAQLGSPELISKLSATVNWTGRRWRMILWFAALIFIIIALARPRWGTQVEYVERQGVEIVVALDVSQSMLAEDLKPNRLARAKLEISELMDQLEGNEIGLVLFSGAAFVQFPLTSDFATARMFLDAADTEIISRPGTAIAEAIEVARTAFNEELATQKVIVLLTDGENHEGDTLAAAEQAAEEEIIIYAIGFGSDQGEPIPVYSELGGLEDYKRDRTGEVILTRLDETTLQDIAILTSGHYFRATADGREIDVLVDEINKLQTSELESRFETRGIERFQIFVLIAVLALIIGELIPDRISPQLKKEEFAAGQVKATTAAKVKR